MLCPSWLQNDSVIYFVRGVLTGELMYMRCARQAVAFSSTSAVDLPKMSPTTKEASTIRAGFRLARFSRSRSAFFEVLSSAPGLSLTIFQSSATACNGTPPFTGSARERIHGDGGKELVVLRSHTSLGVVVIKGSTQSPSCDVSKDLSVSRECSTPVLGDPEWSRHSRCAGLPSACYHDRTALRNQ
jgi:hypothetical protein